MCQHAASLWWVGPEYVTPASRMRGRGGGASGGCEVTQTIIVQLDGKEIARSTIRLLPGIVSAATGLQFYDARSLARSG